MTPPIKSSTSNDLSVLLSDNPSILTINGPRLFIMLTSHL